MYFTLNENRLVTATVMAIIDSTSLGEFIIYFCNFELLKKTKHSSFTSLLGLQMNRKQQLGQT